MGQSKLELAVGTGQWDAGLKKAQQALNSFTQAQGGLQQALAKDNGDMQKFIQMMGKMDSTANTSKGQMNDYKRVLEQLTAQYNQMSDAQRKSIGQDYLQTIDSLKQKFSQAKQQVEDFNKSLGEAGKIKMPDIGSGGGSLFGGGKLGGMLQVFGGNLMTKAAGWATSFASELGDAVKQGIELARQGEGIRLAFERLGRGDILDGLREATHGTVTDLELMKAAVKFNDFRLPLEELGTMLAFAQQKAKDTGQSVDYMVDSIVTGLGRKSLMILDNLGLSAAEIKEKMAETGDMTKAVGEIIREQMQKAGNYVETAADRATQATVQQQNKLEELGRTFQPLAEEANTMWNSIKIGALDLIQTAIQPLIDKLTTAGRLRNLMGQMNAGKGGNTRVQDQLATLAGSSHKDTLYNGIIANYNKLIERRWRAINAYNNNHASINTVLMDLSRQTGKKFSSIQAVKEDIQALEAMKREYIEGAKVIMNPVKIDIKTDEAEQSIDSLNKKLKDLQEQRKKAIAAGDTELSKNLLKQINQTKADIKGLGGSTTNKTTTKTIKTEEQLNNEQIQKLTQEYIKATDDRRKAIEAEIKGLQQRNDEIKKLTDIAQGKVAPEGSLNALNEKLKELQTERGKLSDPIEIEIQDHQIKKVQDEIDRLNGKKVDVELEVNSLSSFEQIQQSLIIKIAEQNMEVDTNTLQTLMQTAIKNGIDSLDPDFASLQEKMREGMNIPDDTWKALQDEINEKLKELGIEPIKIDFKTGNLAKDGQDITKSWRTAASAISTVGSAMSGLKNPAIDIMTVIGQSIATIALSYAENLAGDKTTKGNIWAFIAAAAAATVSMATTIKSIHSSTGYAQGGIVKGNTYSGDQIQANGGTVGLDAGEVILNRAQQGVIASQLESGNGGGMRVVGEIQGEKIVLVANRFLKRSGKGELVTWK